MALGIYAELRCNGNLGVVLPYCEGNIQVATEAARPCFANLQLNAIGCQIPVYSVDFETDFIKRNNDSWVFFADFIYLSVRRVELSHGSLCFVNELP